MIPKSGIRFSEKTMIKQTSACRLCSRPPAHALHEVAPKQPPLLATASTIDVGVDALAEAGISKLLRRPLISTEVASALARWLRSSDVLPL
jgi:hypothetical protein